MYLYIVLNFLRKFITPLLLNSRNLSILGRGILTIIYLRGFPTYKLIKGVPSFS